MTRGNRRQKFVRLAPEMESQVRLGQRFECGLADSEGSGCSGLAYRVICRAKLKIEDVSITHAEWVNGQHWSIRCPRHGQINLDSILEPRTGQR